MGTKFNLSRSRIRPAWSAGILCVRKCSEPHQSIAGSSAANWNDISGRRTIGPYDVVMQPIRLVQLVQHAKGRRVALVEEPRLTLLARHATVYDFVQDAIAGGSKLADSVRENATSESLDYDSIYRGQSEWKLLSAFDHPRQPHRCLVTGTGLTHKASAENRQEMHQTGVISDS